MGSVFLGTPTHIDPLGSYMNTELAVVFSVSVSGVWASPKPLLSLMLWILEHEILGLDIHRNPSREKQAWLGNWGGSLESQGLRERNAMWVKVERSQARQGSWARDTLPESALGLPKMYLRRRKASPPTSLLRPSTSPGFSCGTQHGCFLTEFQE